MTLAWRWTTLFLLCTLSGAAQAGLELQQLESRRDAEGKPVQLPVLVEAPPAEAPLRGVILQMDTGNGKGIIKQEGETPAYGQPTTPLTRARQRLLTRGYALLTPGAPSDRGNGIDRSWREGIEHRQDIQTLVAAARKQFPGVPVIMYGYFSGASSVLASAEAGVAGIDGYIITSGELSWHREDPLARIKAPGLLVQPVSHRCDSIPTPEAREVAAGARWQYVEAGDSKVDTKPGCGTNTRTGLTGLDEAFTGLLLHWLEHEPVPATIGANPAKLAYVESVYMVEGGTRTLFGTTKIELSLFTPPGAGPFPLVVFNHGDVIDGPALTRKVRYRDMVMANEFLSLGFAVAIPARPGVGRSEGTYKRFAGAGGVYIGPATGLLQKGREHLNEGLAALEFLKTLPQIDASRVVMSGQSAGGFAVTCLGLENPAPSWLKAIVNFSGGRTDIKEGEVAKGLNKGMVSVFGVLGQTSRVPSLWIFAENDSRYSAETIRASHAAFVAAGGVAQLELYPAQKEDGHFVYHAPQLWHAPLQAFLAEQGLTRAAPPAKPVQSAPAP